MRGKRSKQYRKLMQSYGMTFGFREPYQVLVDAQMIQDTSRFTMDLIGGLEKALHGKIKPMITQCSIRHLYTLSVPQSEKDPLILFAKNMERRRCNHHELEKPLSTLECLSDVIDPKKSRTNRHRYVIASQEEEVRRFCRGIRGVPLLYVKRSVMILEPMAEGSLGVRDGMEKEKFRTGLRGKPGKRKRDEEEDDTATNLVDGAGDMDVYAQNENGNAEQVKTKRRVRGLKGPNPLSVKKSKKDGPRMEEEEGLASFLVGGKATDGPQEDGANVVETDPDRIDALSGKRKRKRKHRSAKIDDLRQELEGNDEQSA
ncbi:MAG: hypothetical protein L6R37_006710 [Teloschistes peruensis]|nr:MAG: hypothetical protein L6R37_006710 [Teloschistes peruensis]